MAAKLLVVILVCTGLGAVLLGLRQQRLALMHETAVTHAQIDQSRRQMWGSQVRIAQKLEPRQLQESIRRAKLQVEPITPVPALPRTVAHQTDAHPIGRD